jgi:hypothetical protein
MGTIELALDAQTRDKSLRANLCWRVTATRRKAFSPHRLFYEFMKCMDAHSMRN